MKKLLALFLLVSITCFSAPLYVGNFEGGNFTGNASGLTNAAGSGFAPTNSPQFNGHMTIRTFGQDGSLVMKSTDLGGTPITRHTDTIDLQHARFDVWQTATDGNSILGGFANTAAGDGDYIQDNAVIVNGTLCTNSGLESIIVNGISTRLLRSAHSQILGGPYSLIFETDYATILGGSNLVTGGVGSMIGGYAVQRTNNWEFFYGVRTNGLSIMPTNGTITAAGNMRWVGNAGGLTGLTNLWGLGATNSLTVVNGIQTNSSRFTTEEYGGAVYVLNTLYTNRNQVATVDFTVDAIGVLGADDIAFAYLLVDQDHSGTFEETRNRVGMRDIVGTASFQIFRELQPNARFMLSNHIDGLGEITVQGSHISYK